MVEPEYAQLNVYLPKDLSKKFKIKCIQEGKTLKEVLFDFVTAYVGDENDKGARDSKPDEVKKD